MEISSPITGSKLLYGDNLDLFSTQPTNISSIHVEQQTFFPFGSVKDSSSPFIDFIITPSNSLYTDLSSSRLFVDVKILKKDSTEISDSSTVTLCSNALGSLFSGAEIFNDGQSTGNLEIDFYPYRSYLYNLLNYGAEAKRTVLSSQLWYQSTNEANDDTNAGLKARKALTSGSKVVSMCGNLITSITNQTRWIPPGVELQIKLRRNSDQFLLVGKQDANTEYKIVLDNLKYVVKRHVVHPEIIKMHSEKLSKGEKYKFPLQNVVVKTFPIQSGSNGQISHTICSGVLPRMLAVGMTKLTSFQGDWSDPFTFKDFDLKECSVIIDGNAFVTRSFKIDENSKSLAVFDALNDSTLTSKLGLGVDRDTFLKGTYILMFDLAQKQHPAQFVYPRQGNLKLQLEYSKALPEAINVFTWAFYDAQLCLDKYLNPTIEETLQ
jgi:hypothetical protein